MRGGVPAQHCAAVNSSTSFQQRSVTAEAHGQGCGLRASTTHCNRKHCRYSSASTAPLITALRSIIAAVFHRRTVPSTAAPCLSSAPSSVLHFSARHPLRSTPAVPHVSRPPAAVRLETGLAYPGVPGTVGLPYAGLRYITAEAHGQGCGLRASIPLQSAYSSPQSPSRLQTAYQEPHQAVRPPSRSHLRSRSGIYQMRYGEGTEELPLRLRGVAHFPPVVSTIGTVAAAVL